jgi:hypothetical protein
MFKEEWKIEKQQVKMSPARAEASLIGESEAFRRR